MAYCDAEDCLSQTTAKELIQMFHDKATTAEAELEWDDFLDEVEDDHPLAMAINGASAQIDSYLRRRYLVPLTTVPADILRAAVTLTLYEGFTRRHAGTQPVQDGYDRAIKWLTQISKGEADIGAEPPPSANTTRQIGSFGDARVMTDAALKGLL